MPKTPNVLIEVEITTERSNEAEAEIRDKQKPVDYDTKEYPVEILVQKYTYGLLDETNELFIPDYQREMTWDEVRQSKFILITQLDPQARCQGSTVVHSY